MNKPSCTIITPTIGSIHLAQCIKSVQEQTYQNIKHLIVVDGENNLEKMDDYDPGINMLQDNLQIALLPENVGSGGWYGHRIYAAFSFLVNTDYVIYLDEDNWLEPNHVQSLLNTLYLGNGKPSWSDWSFSYRTICDKQGKFICKDEFESRGDFHIDTSSFCISREIATKIGHAWYGKWGADRQFFNTLKTCFPKYGPSGEYSLNYRLDGNPGSPTKEFFLQGNEQMRKRDVQN